MSVYEYILVWNHLMHGDSLKTKIVFAFLNGQHKVLFQLLE